MGKKWLDKASGDHSVIRCEEGTLKLYSEAHIHKMWASWYFKGDILVKKVFKTYRYFGQDVIKDQIYPCKNTDDPEAAAACNNHWCSWEMDKEKAAYSPGCCLDFCWCSWEMDKEKAACYKNLCQHSATPEGCFNENCRNDWSPPPTPRSTAGNPPLPGPLP